MNISTRFAESAPASIETTSSSSNANANAVEPLTPTASAVASIPGLLPADQFVLPVADASNPLMAPEILAPWPLLRIIQKNDMNAIVATRPIAAGEKIAKFYGEVSTIPTMYTLQINENVHVTCSQGGPTYTNHSCDPNAFFDMEFCTASAPFPILTALRPIALDEEISFHYCQNEWSMAVPFFCLCGSAKCLGKIEGFSKLPIETKRQFQPYLSPFLAAKWREEEAQSQSSSKTASE